MATNSGDMIKTAVAGAAILGTIVHSQYKYAQLKQEVDVLRAEVETVAKYVKLLESKLAGMLSGNIRVNTSRGEEIDEETESSEEEEFSDTSEEEPAPQPARRQERRRADKPKSRARPSRPAERPAQNPRRQIPKREVRRPAIPIPQDDIESEEYIEQPSSNRRAVETPKRPASNVNSGVFRANNNRPRAPQPRIQPQNHQRVAPPKSMQPRPSSGQAEERVRAKTDKRPPPSIGGFATENTDDNNEVTIQAPNMSNRDREELLDDFDEGASTKSANATGASKTADRAEQLKMRAEARAKKIAEAKKPT